MCLELIQNFYFFSSFFPHFFLLHYLFVCLVLFVFSFFGRRGAGRGCLWVFFFLPSSLYWRRLPAEFDLQGLSEVSAQVVL